MNKQQAIDILKDYTDFMDIQRTLMDICKLSSSERVKRGPLQRQIATKLNLTVNPRFYSLLDKVMDNLPVREIKVQGVPHYKGLVIR